MQLNTEKSNHINALTGMRFFAALLVLLMHFSEYIKLPDIILPIIKAGGIGVSFFFVLSGFLLYLRYGSLFEESIKKKDLANFYKARFFRIYPAYFLGLLIATLIHFIAFYKFNSNPSFANAKISGWIVNLFALQTFSGNIFTQQFWNAPSWSVSTEFFFYLSFPFLIFYFTKELKSRFNIAIGVSLFFITWILLRTIVVFGSFAGWFEKTLWVDYISDRNFFWRFWEFGIGALSGKFFLMQEIKTLSTEKNRNFALILSITAIFAIAYAPWPTGEMSQLLTRVMRLAILNVIPFAFIIALFCCGRNFLSKIMENKLIIYLGECSFAIYIYHWSFWIILEHTHHLKIQITEAMVISCIAGTILLSMASYSFYENPLRKWATKKFINR